MNKLLLLLLLYQGTDALVELPHWLHQGTALVEPEGRLASYQGTGEATNCISEPCLTGTIASPWYCTRTLALKFKGIHS
jgi:hypothetical protein